MSSLRTQRGLAASTSTRLAPWPPRRLHLWRRTSVPPSGAAREPPTRLHEHQGVQPRRGHGRPGRDLYGPSWHREAAGTLTVQYEHGTAAFTGSTGSGESRVGDALQPPVL